MPVDSFAFLPRSFRAEYETIADAPDAPVWAPLAKPVSEAKVALLTSAGIYIKGSQQPFDLDRERAEPTWGDPTYRLIPRDAAAGDIGAAHLHINCDNVTRDPDVALPLGPFAELEADGTIGALADEHYSFMGYQSRDLIEWRDRYGPEVIEHLKAGAVDAVVLAPA